ncbi:hypothetical protein [Streptomyces sp. NPDC006012]|uniref:hypothetical protein n=1 Tax=Streptomyces sp. NPDC006012 TaxID=3364739 RepID=UPI00368C23DC
MGVLRRIRCGLRGTRLVAVAGLAVLAVGGTVACQPGGLNSATAAYTTDWTATARLEREHIGVSWLTCTGGDATPGRGTAAGTPAAGGTPSATETTVVSVDCQGRTKDGRMITVTGRVTRAVGGACVRGDLVAAVDGKERFRAGGLGDCDATPGPPYTPPVTYRPPSVTYRPPSVTYRPPGGPPPAPTVTVTVTRTVWCETDPRCRPVAGK